MFKITDIMTRHATYLHNKISRRRLAAIRFPKYQVNLCLFHKIHKFYASNIGRGSIRPERL